MQERYSVKDTWEQTTPSEQYKGQGPSGTLRSVLLYRTKGKVNLIYLWFSKTCSAIPAKNSAAL